MYLLKLGSELQNFTKKISAVLNMKTICRLDFHEVEYAPLPFLLPWSCARTHILISGSTKRPSSRKVKMIKHTCSQNS